MRSKSHSTALIKVITRDSIHILCGTGSGSTSVERGVRPGRRGHRLITITNGAGMFPDSILGLEAAVHLSAIVGNEAS